MRAFQIALSALMIGAAAPAAAPQSGAAPPDRAAIDTLIYLRDEPASLFDLGLYRLERDAALAMGALDPVQFRDPRVRAVYDFRSRTIRLVARATTPPDLRSEERCAEAFARIVNAMTQGYPEGAGRIGFYLESVFGHALPRPGGDAPELSETLPQLVELSLKLAAPAREQLAGDVASASCRGRLNEKPDALTVQIVN